MSVFFDWSYVFRLRHTSVQYSCMNELPELQPTVLHVFANLHNKFATSSVKITGCLICAAAEHLPRKIPTHAHLTATQGVEISNNDSMRTCIRETFPSSALAQWTAGALSHCGRPWRGYLSNLTFVQQYYTLLLRWTEAKQENWRNKVHHKISSCTGWRMEHYFVPIWCTSASERPGQTSATFWRNPLISSPGVIITPVGIILPYFTPPASFIIQKSYVSRYNGYLFNLK